MKILIVGPSWVGDTVMAQALFKLLKARHRRCSLHVLAPAWTFSLLSLMEEVDKTIPFPIGHGELKLKRRYQIGKNLRKEGYDQAVILPNSFKSALVPYFAKIKQRTGWLREGRGVILNDGRRLNRKRFPLMVEQYLALGMPADFRSELPNITPAFTVPVMKLAEVADKFAVNITEKPILAIAAGAEFGPSKRWPAKYYAAIAKEHLAKGWDVWLFGSPNDLDAANHIMQETKDQCLHLTGKTSLAETIILMSAIKGLVTNDSGLMHVAAAMKKPLLAIYGSTSPDFTPPLSQSATVLQLDLPCQPCFKRHCPLKHHACMETLTPEMALDAMKDW